MSNFKYTIDYTYFEKIDRPDKAYFLGLLYADGCNAKENRTVSINLQEGDSYILEKFKTAIGYNKPLYFKKKVAENYQNQKILYITNKIYCEQLDKLGMTPRKSLTLQFPNEQQVPKELLRHFIRGYMDGDGSVSLTGSCVVSFSVSRNFGKSLQEYIYKNLEINPQFRSDKSIYDLRFGGRLQCIKFLDWIYADDNDLHLNRKYDKYIEMKKKLPSKNNDANSNFIGVFFNKSISKDGKWTSYYRLGKEKGYRIIYIGQFDTEIDAAKAYNNYVLIHNLDKTLNPI